MEILNLLVGFELIVVGLFYLAKLDITSAASWSIFGCMYIVMDKYSALENKSRKRQLVERIKYSSAWLGFIISTAFLGYVILTI
ncbi:MAG: hypothetical protein AAF849_06085 [Bacteroidota bacterium]